MQNDDPSRTGDQLCRDSLTLLVLHRDKSLRSSLDSEIQFLTRFRKRVGFAGIGQCHQNDGHQGEKGEAENNGQVHNKENNAGFTFYYG